MVGDLYLLPHTFMALATAQEKSPANTNTNQKPVQTFRLRGISASVFENHATSGDRDVKFHKVSLQRTYKDGDEFKTTTSFGRDDLPIAMHVLHQAWQFILETESGRANSDDQ